MKRRARSKWFVLVLTAVLFCILVLVIKFVISGNIFSLAPISELPIDLGLVDEPDASDTGTSTDISFELITDDMDTLADETSRSRLVLFSTPLVVFDRAVATPFRPEEVIAETNRMRVGASLPPLKYNPLLAKAAQAKVKDMFEQQYFEHKTPQGKGPDFFVTDAGYDYISIGENLALGNFGDEGGLVDAWMESQGHRENILREQFTEIGVAIGRGTYNGQRVTIAVQHFGKPATDCPSVRADLRAKISQLRAGLATQATALDAIKRQIEEDADDQQETRIAAYNAAVDAYNQDVAEIKTATETYNQSVRVFNACLEAQ